MYLQCIHELAALTYSRELWTPYSNKYKVLHELKQPQTLKYSSVEVTNRLHPETTYPGPTLTPLPPRVSLAHVELETVTIPHSTLDDLLREDAETAELSYSLYLLNFPQPARPYLYTYRCV
jgi:hypothetical protein